MYTASGLFSVNNTFGGHSHPQTPYSIKLNFSKYSLLRSTATNLITTMFRTDELYLDQMENTQAQPALLIHDASAPQPRSSSGSKPSKDDFCLHSAHRRQTLLDGEDLAETQTT